MVVSEVKRMLFVQLTDEQRREVRQVSRQAVGRVALRAQMVLLSDRSFSVPQIAEIHDCGEDVVRTWLHRYQEQGVAGLEDEPRSGGPPKDPMARHVVDAQASQSPECSGHIQSCWTVRLLAAFLATRFHLHLSPATVRRLLHERGWRWRRPRLAPAGVLRRKQDPQAAVKLAAIERAKDLAAHGLIHLLFCDECDLHLLPVVRAMWMKGERVRVPTPGQNARHAFFGALDAASGVFHWSDHDRKLAVSFVAFLDQLALAYPERPLYLVLDSAPTHTAKAVERWLALHPRVQVLWLPKYAAHEVNPAERIWGLMKDEVAANRLAGSMAFLVVQARRFFGDLTPHPVALPQAA
jgi:transposase